MDWTAVVWAGFIATTLAVTVLWMLRSVRLMRFSSTVLVGCLLMRDPENPRTDTAGFLVLFLLGSSLVPAIYSLLFRAAGGPSLLGGAAVGLVHGLITVGALPGLGTISACVRAGRMPAPGVAGREWGWPTPVSIATGHVVYGAAMGAILAGF